MNRINQHGVVRTVTAATVLALASLAGPAIAQQSGTSAPKTTVTTQTTSVTTDTTTASHTGSAPGMDRDEMRLRSLHDKLMIKPAQESLWAEVAKVMRANDDKIDALIAERHAKAATMTAVDDLRSYGEITEQHAIGIKTFVPAFERLYDSMTAEQKANADQVFRSKAGKTASKGK